MHTSEELLAVLIIIKGPNRPTPGEITEKELPTSIGGDSRGNNTAKAAYRVDHGSKKLDEKLIHLKFRHATGRKPLCT